VSTVAPYWHFKYKKEILTAVTMNEMDRKFSMMKAAVVS
jgi:hypothetical protein